MGKRRTRKRFLRRLERSLYDFAIQALAELAGHVLGDAIGGKRKKHKHKRKKHQAMKGVEESPRH